METIDHQVVRAMAGAVTALTGSDGSIDIYTITECALRQDRHVTAEIIADYVREAREEWAAEREHQARQR